MNLRHLLFTGAYILCIINIALGQEVPSDTLRHYQMDQVVITGTRLPLEKGRIPASITVVPEDIIDRENQTNVLSVLNARVPGLFLNERGMVGFGVGPQSGGGISIRGLGSSGDPANTRTLVLVDGQPQFMGVFGHPIHDSYFSSNVERVEVIRGPASILYGSNAMGGVVNIITRQQRREGLALGARAAYGSFETFESDVSVGYRMNRFNILGIFNHAETGGHRKDAQDEFTTTGGYLKAGYRISDYFRTSLDANLSDSRFYDPGTVEQSFSNHYFDFVRGRVAVSLENTIENLEGALRLFYNFGEHDFHDSFRSNDYNRGVTFYQNIRLIPNNILTLGIDYKNYGGEARTDAPIPRNEIDESVDETDFYGLVQHTLFDNLNLNLGLRWVINSAYGNIAVPHYGLAYALTDDIRLKASASKGFRSPTLANLFFAVPANEELQPEEMWSYEVSYLQELFDDRLSLELTGFINEGKNLIMAVVQGAPPPRNINTGAFRHKGIEFQGAFAVTNNLNISANYSYLEMENPLPYAPQHQFNLHAHYNIQGLRFMIGARRVSGLIRGTSGNVPVDYTLPKMDFTLLNAQVHYPFLNMFTVFARVDNILNQEYAIDKGYPLPGINMMAGLRFRW
jgi:outer membrane cobalamin receptor